MIGTSPIRLDSSSHVSSPPVSSSRKQEAARYGLDHVRERFPLGGVNREDRFRAGSHEERKQFMEQLLLSAKAKEAMAQEEALGQESPPERQQQMASELKGGHCGILSRFARWAMLERYADLKVELAATKEHELVVVGRDPHSDACDPDTWGLDAQICDPWAGITYPASQFRMVKMGADIPSIIPSVYQATGKIETKSTHYLDGDIRIVTPPKRPPLSDSYYWGE